jgi:putative hydrolase of the HAD superfamily
MNALTPSAPVRAVVFDYGGVLTTPVGDSIRAWLEVDGILPDSFTRVLKEWLGRAAPFGTPIHRLETGEMSVEEFDRALAGRLRTRAGTPISPVGVLSRLFAAMQPQETMWALAEEICHTGTRVALLSNSWGNDYPLARLGTVFDPVVISGDVGLRKPDAAIYELTLRRLGVPAAEAVFVDDALPNIEGARAVGMRALHHTDPLTTRMALEAVLPQLRSI